MVRWIYLAVDNFLICRNLNDSFIVESNRESEVPYIVVVYDAFLLTTYCMKPYSDKLSDSKRILGYKLSSAWRATEDVFGVLSNRFWVLSSRMYLQPNDTTKITLACCVLYNIMRTHSKNSFSPSGFADEVEENENIKPGEWRDGNNSVMQPLAATTSRHPSHNAEKIRDICREYLYGRG